MEQGKNAAAWAHKHHILVVFLLSILLMIIFTYPAILHMNDALIGIKEDNQQNYWVLWHIQQAVTRSDVDLYHTDSLYYPLGADLALHTLDLMDSLFLALPLELFFSLIVTYNILILAGFALALVSMYLLALYLTKNRYASFIAGIIFAFSPYHTAHALHHINLSSVEFIPLYVLFLFKMFDEPCKKHSILAAVFLTMLSLNSWYYLVYMVLFSILYLLWHVIVVKRGVVNIVTMKYIFFSALLFTVLIAPFLYPVVKESISAQRLSNTWGQELFVTDLLAPIIPPALHTLSQLHHHALAPIYLKLSGNVWESTRFLGYLVIILSLIAIVQLPFLQTGFWWITGLIYLVLSFGPQLHVLGQPVFNYMPYSLFAKIPFLNLARVPSRFVLVTMLCLAVLVAKAFVWISERWKKRTINGKSHGISLVTVLFLLISLTILFEFSTIPTPMLHYTIPSFYQSVIHDPGDYALVEAPLFDWRMNDEAMFLQTFHHKRLLFGSLSHIPKEELQQYYNAPFFKIMALPKEYLPKYQDEDTSILQKYHVKYIILHPEYYRYQDEYVLVKKYLDAKFLKLEQPDPRIIVYMVK